MLQAIFALIILRWPLGAAAFSWLADQVAEFLNYVNAGTIFVYGFLVDVPEGLQSLGAFSVFAFAVKKIKICWQFKNRSIQKIFRRSKKKFQKKIF